MDSEEKKLFKKRERQLKINEASRKCRRRQKIELHYLRARTIELEGLLVSQTNQTNQTNQTQTQMSIKKEEDRSLSSDACSSSSDNNTSSPLSSHLPLLSSSRKEELRIIGLYLLQTLRMETRAFSPNSISTSPLYMDGFELRLNITSKSFTIHSSKFFRCLPQDLYHFCWENSNSPYSTREKDDNEKSTFCKMIPLDANMNYMIQKTVGQWSFAVHGIPHVSFTSVLCRGSDDEYFICQQSVVEEKDCQDPSTLPWLFRRWVIFRESEDELGRKGTLVESFRTASYATGKSIYSETAAYDAFLQHFIRRYGESNALLENLMMNDGRFPLVERTNPFFPTEWNTPPADTSERFVTNLLLF